MGKDRINLQETKQMFIHVAERMIESKDELTKADQAIGDGDHGIGMARGFEAVKQTLSTTEFFTLGPLLKNIGMTLLTSVGGAAGAIYGTFFKGAADNLEYKAIFDSSALDNMLKDGLLAVIIRGDAQEGDKTMADALFPAATKSGEMINEPLDISLREVVEAARIGMEKTKDMIAKIGKAKTLGERSLGHADPGAISTYLILKFMNDFVNEI